MPLAVRPLFTSELLTIRYVLARPSPTQSDDTEHETADQMLLPISGLFARHDHARQHFIANANHAVFISRERQYRYSYPGGIGDECLVLEFSKAALTDLLVQNVGVQDLHASCLRPHCLLSPATVINRSLLWRQLQRGAIESLAIEEISVSMLSAALQAACNDSRRIGRARHALTMARRRRQVEAVKEAISLDPAREWTLDQLAGLAHGSPFHLARIFREEVGVPIHQYLIRTRLGTGLDALCGAGADLTAIALEAGFANHSHFTSRFRSHFGITPSQFRLRMHH